jgi:hypothetical protein
MRPAVSFYATSCHPPLTRRRFLAGATATLGVLHESRLWAAPSEPAQSVIERYATRPDDPWAVCHGLRATGRAFKISDARPAVDFLLERHLSAVPTATGSALGFPLDVEAHQNMFLKTLLEPGVPPAHPFVREGRRQTLQDVVDGAHALFRPLNATSQPNFLPWSVIALTRTTLSIKPRWTNGFGESVDLDAIVETALGMPERASTPIGEAMREGRPLTAQTPVHHFTCGGTHMLYSLLTAVQQGHVGRDRTARVQRQVDLLVWRLGADVALMDPFCQQAHAGQPTVFWFKLDAKLKLLGHAEECLAFAEKRGVASLTVAQRAQRRAGVAALARMLAELGARGLGEAQALDRELFRQLVGDTCHARHGLMLT